MESVLSFYAFNVFLPVCTTLRVYHVIKGSGIELCYRCFKSALKIVLNHALYS